MDAVVTIILMFVAIKFVHELNKYKMRKADEEFFAKSKKKYEAKTQKDNDKVQEKDDVYNTDVSSSKPEQIKLNRPF